MNPHSVLLVIEKPPEGAPTESEWQTLSQHIQAAAQTNRQIETLAENCLLIPMQSGLQTASELMARAGRSGLRCRAMFFADKPDWVDVKKDSPPEV